MTSADRNAAAKRIAFRIGPAVAYAVIPIRR
jgi:hypothetical protein